MRAIPPHPSASQYRVEMVVAALVSEGSVNAEAVRVQAALVTRLPQ